MAAFKRIRKALSFRSLLLWAGLFLTVQRELTGFVSKIEYDEFGMVSKIEYDEFGMVSETEHNELLHFENRQEKVLDSKLTLMPLPSDVSLNDEGGLILNTYFQVKIIMSEDERLFRAATRFLARLAGRTGLFFENNIPISDDNNPRKVPVLVIHCHRKGKVELGEDESYSIQISSTQVNLEAETFLGALHGMETLLQLISIQESKFHYWPTGYIHDKPRFPWRGLLLDAGRHFMPVDVILRNLDAMAAVKLNVLHWHLTEDQGFRVECLSHPNLHRLGSDGQYYKQSEIKEIVEYALDRGIRIVPEFDLPGHATSWLVGYPDLGSSPGPFEIDRQWGISDHVMDPTNEYVYSFLEQFLKEMARLFPDPFVHIGGDEVKTKEWNESKTIQQFMRNHKISNAKELQAFFNNRILNILHAEEKRMIGWDEILHPRMPQTTVIQSWRGRDSMIKAARQGYQSILSKGYYIDLCLSTAEHYQNDPLPPNIKLTPEEQQLILGGEAAMWSELVSPETVDSRIWPRTAAIAERLWSPRNVSNVEDMYRRLDIVSYQLEEHGVTHLKNYEMLLRRMVRGSDVTALRNLVDVLEPVPGYQRRDQREYTSFSPLTRVVDAARPDASVARKFRSYVNQFLHSYDQNRTEDRIIDSELVEWLTLWSLNHQKLAVSIDGSPMLQEIESLSTDLSSIASFGLRAMEQLRSPNTTTAMIHWKSDEWKTLKRSKRPRGQTQLMVISAIGKLMVAASGK